MALPTGMEAYMLQVAGDPCSFTSGSVTTNFYGILDEASTMDSDTSGMPVFIVGTHLTVERSIGNMLSKDMVVTVNGINYQVRQVNKNNDPYLSLVEVVEVTS